jgi:NitT/TauT family transport system substrate-binding protein
LGGAGGAAPSPAPVALKYAYSATSIVFIAQKMALEQGFYRQLGLEMEQVLMGAGVMAAAQLAGEVEYTNSYPATIHSAAQGAPLRIVSTVVDAPLFAYVVRPDVQSLADLRGKAVGITTRGGAVDKVTRALLAQQGLDADTDVTILPAGGQVTVLMEALLSGRVQAAALSAPWYVRARDQGMRVLIKAPEVLHEPQNGLAVTVDRLAQQRDQVRRVVQAETQAIRFMKENRAATVALARDWLEISQAEAEESYDFALPAFIPDGRIDVPGLVRYVADEKADGTLPADFQIESILDTNLAEEALRALEARR